MKTRFFYLVLTGILLTLVACSGNKATSLYSNYAASAPPPESPADDGTIYPLALQIESAWEGSPTSEIVLSAKDCKFTTADAVGSSKTCNLSMPEGRLWFSNLKFSVISYPTGASSKMCEIAIFRPYFYLANNNSAAFLPWWSPSEIDCTVLPLEKGCYGGVGTDLLSSFPQATSSVFLPAYQTSATWKMTQTAHQVALKGSSGGSNNYFTNTLSDRTVPLNFGNDAYVADSMQDYSVHCLDRWGQPLYSIDLLLDDDAPSSGYTAPPVYNESGFKSLWP